MPLLAVDWNINPLVFLEFFVVLAFAVGWLILEWVANRHDRKRRSGTAEQGDRAPEDPRDS